MKLRCPIKRHYLWNGHLCYINQLKGENKNRLFYGKEGHRGIDIRTTGHWKYKKVGQWRWRKGRWVDGSWEKISRDKYELQGRIPLSAVHEGSVRYVLHSDKLRTGWGLYITAKPKNNTQYRSLYWHIESPWRSLSRFSGVVKQFIGREVRPGAIVAIAGNNGKSTGPHLHLELQKRTLYNGVWTNWERLDPVEYFQDDDIIYQRYYGMSGSDYFYKGQKVTKKRAKEIINSLPKVV